MTTRLPLAALAATLVLAAPAAATTITVTRTDDPTSGANQCSHYSINCSLRNAVAAAANTDSITLSPGTYTLNGELLVTKVISINGAGARTTTIEQTKPSNRVIDVDHAAQNAPEADLALSGVTLTGGLTDDTTHNGSGGAGIYVGSGNLTLAGDEVIDNIATASSGGTGAALGGGIEISGGGTAFVSETTIENNRANANGAGIGGIADFGGLSIENSTINGNVGTTSENDSIAIGGIDVGFFSSGNLVARSVTIASNRGTGATGTSAINAGNLVVAQGTASLGDSILAAGTGDAGHENCVVSPPSGTLTSAGYNLQDRPDNCGITGSGDLANADPALGPLVDNGGPTDTRALGPGSAAIDAGNPAGCQNAAGSKVLTTDQRGHPRSGRCDIGAYELDQVANTGGGGTNGGAGGGNDGNGNGTPGGGAQQTPAAPRLSALSLAPATFRAAASGPSIAGRKRRPPVGTTISYRDTQAATTTLTVSTSARGVRSGRRCVAPPRRRPRHAPRRCTRTLTLGTFAHRDVAGLNRLRFTGRLHGHRLAPGTYRLRATARNAARRTSNAVAAAFRIVG